LNFAVNADAVIALEFHGDGAGAVKL